MAPVFEKVNENALQPYMNEEMTSLEAFEAAMTAATTITVTTKTTAPEVRTVHKVNTSCGLVKLLVIAS